MEIYTGDFIDIAEKYATKISKAIKNNDYIIADECCNLQHELCQTIHTRLESAFKQLIEEEKKKSYGSMIRSFELSALLDELFKTINEL
jgi:hypothetical protein